MLDTPEDVHMRETPSSCLGSQNFSMQPGSERKGRVNRIVWWVLIRNIYHPGLPVPWSGSELAAQLLCTLSPASYGVQAAELGRKA